MNEVETFNIISEEFTEKYIELYERIQELEQDETVREYHKLVSEMGRLKIQYSRLKQYGGFFGEEKIFDEEPKRNR